MDRQDDKGTALITGASSGIGALYAHRLARRGYDLVLVGRNIKRLDALATQLDDETLAGIQCIATDLTDPAGLRRIEQILRTDATISLLVNSAGTGLTAPVLKSDLDIQEKMIALNVTALMRLTHAAAQAFVQRKAGGIINIASIVALAPEVLNGVYGGTKAFVLAFSQALCHELKGANVRLQVVLPGAIATGFWELAGMPLQDLPPQMVMSAEELVDAALAGFDLGEVVTIPSLPDFTDWESLEASRLALRPKLSMARAATRYKTARTTSSSSTAAESDCNP